VNDTAATTAVDRLLAIVEQLAQENRPGQAMRVSAASSFERDLGLDSLARVELMQRVGQQFGVELPPQALAEADSALDLLAFLAPHAVPAGMPVVQPLPGDAGAGTPESARTMLEVLEWHIARQPGRLHVLLREDERESPLSYRDLVEAARTLATGLAARGLRPRQTVALMLPPGRDYLASFFGVMMAGGIPVPIYPPARLAGIEEHLRRHSRILSNAEAALIITIDAGKRVARMLQASVPTLAAIVTPADLRNAGNGRTFEPAFHAGPADIAFLQYTSGSTGDPKGVILTHANLLANMRALIKAAQAGPEDRFVSWLPLYHDMGLIGAWFCSLYLGIPLALMSPLDFLARPALWLETMSRHRGTIAAAPNFAYELCTRHVPDEVLGQLDLSCWRLALNGAEPVGPATLDGFAKRFAVCGLRREAMTPVYGLAESSVGLAFPPPGRGPRVDVIARVPFAHACRAIPAENGEPGMPLVCCGFPLSGHEMRVVDDTGVELPERHVGRLQFRGPSSTAGYFRNPDATRALVHGDWLDTGDNAYMADGEVFPAGRVKDLIKRGGRNLYPYDLEQAVGQLAGIRKGCVAVFGSPDPASGTERVVVVAETRVELAGCDQLRQAINSAAVDVIGMPPDDVVLAPPHAVPKTSSGKIRRVAAREAYERGTLAKATAPPWLQMARLAGQAAGARATVLARRAGNWLYTAYAWAVFGVVLLGCALPTILFQQPLRGRRIMHRGARACFRLLGTMPRASGLDQLPQRPHVLLVNHASYLDAVALTALLPDAPGYAFAAKGEFAKQWWMRRLLTGVGAVFVERLDVRRSTEDVALIASALQQGGNLLMFPEGTLERYPGIRQFRGGAFAAAQAAGVPVVVAALRGTREAMRAGSWRPRPAHINLMIGPVLWPDGSGWAAVARLRDTARRAMAELSGETALPDMQPAA
jgi:1-acyl-sn-glycerol-3-phosphate acyltransferase